MRFTRRDLLAGVSGFTAAAGMDCRGAHAAESIPELTLAAQEGTLRLRDSGPDTAVLRYGSTSPLVVLRTQQNVATQIRLRNNLKEVTSLQICGARGQGSLDDPGLRSATAIPSGEEAVLRFTPAESGTAWFRPRLGSLDQAGRGLAGVLIVDPPTPHKVDEDAVVFLRDWTLDAQDKPTKAASVASLITAGNAPLPTTRTLAPGARLRLRLVNGSTRRVMVVACEGARPMIVAIDGQPSELFEPIRNTVPIGPGARFDLMLDLPRPSGQSVKLILRGSERVEGAMEPDRVIALFNTDGAPLEARPPIAALAANPALPPRIPLEASKRAELKIGASGAVWTVNGISGVELPAKPVLRVKRGDAVTLGFNNASQEVVPLSLYGQAMRLLHPNDDGWEPYWRDTVLLPPGSRNHVAFVADKAGRWPIESGFNTQAAGGLRCWFEVA